MTSKSQGYKTQHGTFHRTFEDAVFEEIVKFMEEIEVEFGQADARRIFNHRQRLIGILLQEDK